MSPRVASERCVGPVHTWGGLADPRCDVDSMHGLGQWLSRMFEEGLVGEKLVLLWSKGQAEGTLPLLVNAKMRILKNSWFSGVC